MCLQWCTLRRSKGFVSPGYRKSNHTMGEGGGGTVAPFFYVAGSRQCCLSVGLMSSRGAKRFRSRHLYLCTPGRPTAHQSVFRRNLTKVSMCGAFECNSRFESGKRLFRVSAGKQEVARRKKWLRKINRKNFAPTRHTRLSEVGNHEGHFTSGAFEPQSAWKA